MSSDSLKAISSIDGRYASRTEKLSPYMSEQGLMSYRIKVEVEYLIALSKVKDFGPREFTKDEETTLRAFANLSNEGAQIIKEIEMKGYKDIPATKHDVKAIEYYLRTQFEKTALQDVSEWIHFGLTSEDVNNLSYALMLRDAMEEVMIPGLERILAKLSEFVSTYGDAPMLARTHGQPASPTTFGKEIAVFYKRLHREQSKLSNFSILAKLNGATGNYNALAVAESNIDWITFSKNTIDQFNTSDKKIKLEANLYTTQIEPHDSYVELFQILFRINTILLDLNQDLWRYISDGWVVQKPVAGEIGSSTMPHKVNPIDFENSEGNLGLANALFSFFATKLPISRLQRDLSDSTVERNFGTAFAHTLLGYESLLSGLGKVSANTQEMKRVLTEHPEVLTEAIQTILRREGATDAYEKLMSFSRGKKITMDDLQTFISGLSVSDAVKKELLALRPENYTGLATKLAKSCIS